jgi:hypothetical protein
VLSIIEYHLPRIWKLYNTLKLWTGVSSVDRDSNKDHMPQWVKDFKLVEWGKQALFFEYLEMGEL